MKNLAKLEAMGAPCYDLKYYYLKFGEVKHGRPAGGIATVCLLKYYGLIHRGIAFCSPLDQFVRKEGRNIALGRAIKAMEKRVSSEPIPQNTPAGILKHRFMDFLSTFSAGLTDYEKKLAG